MRLYSLEIYKYQLNSLFFNVENKFMFYFFGIHMRATHVRLENKRRCDIQVISLCTAMTVHNKCELSVMRCGSAYIIFGIAIWNVYRE